jgi:hypothetical protein
MLKWIQICPLPMHKFQSTITFTTVLITAYQVRIQESREEERNGEQKRRRRAERK